MPEVKDLQIDPGSFVFVNGAVIARTPDGNLQVSASAQVLTKDDLITDLAAANSPTKRIYYVLQSILLDPDNASTYRQQLMDLLCDRTEVSLLQPVVRSLGLIRSLAEQGEIQSAMAVCRRLVEFDDSVLSEYPAAS
jgi:flagellar protein FlbT